MPKRRRQCAALPFKQEAGETWVMLITSRDTGRWILPKGWVEKRTTDAGQAAKEAYEEGGIIGETAAEPIYRYRYAKRLTSQVVECAVDVFPLRVTALRDKWPEAHQRRRQWFTLGQAALHIDDGDLVTMLLQLAANDTAPGPLAQVDPVPARPKRKSSKRKPAKGRKQSKAKGKLNPG